MKTAAAFLALLAAPLALHAAEAIQDNSFLVEEAYNQEEGVVQHINTYQRFRDTGNWLYTFTQEWPVGGITHQLSYTIPVTRLFDQGDHRTGIGDVALNYRYQLVGSGETRLAIAPRFSLLLSSGNEKQGRGAGATAYQVEVPMSYVLGEQLVSHTNLGYTWTPHARDAEGDSANLAAWNFGQSFVWLAHPRVNGLLEYIYVDGEAVTAPGTHAPARASYLSPGVRWSYNFDSGLQIVPGIAFPIGVGPSRGQKSVFLYLSFEHPFRK